MARACCEPSHAAYWLAWQPEQAALPTNVGPVGAGGVTDDRGSSHHADAAAPTPMAMTQAAIHARVGRRVRSATTAGVVVAGALGATAPGRFGFLRFLRVTG